MPVKFIPMPFWFLLLAMMAPAPAHALSCNFSDASINFGSIDTLSDRPVSTNATFIANCSNGVSFSSVLICLDVGGGSGGATESMRRMAMGGSFLNYQLYTDSAHTQIWGSYAWPFQPRSPSYSIQLNLLGSGSARIPIYGTLFGRQNQVVPGTYFSSFSGGHINFRYRYYGFSNSCSLTTSTESARPGLSVTATVPANCRVATQDVDFGARGVLDSNIDATGRISVTCTYRSDYSIGLSGGLAKSSPTARKMFKGNESITYGLYKDAARTQPWGDADLPGSRVSGSGSGASQSFVVYGRVPPQATPSPGVYTDTVVVTIVY